MGLRTLEDTLRRGPEFGAYKSSFGARLICLPLLLAWAPAPLTIACNLLEQAGRKRCVTAAWSA
ncbi:hypothetical protein GCM10025771_37600 [Niveibacterium umoris]|uniref:Uncharacterized protein n=1 Tax=Niveibacterium umoris TaxID=1193620 RepID=A0A840BBX4_9RHOO|nr:hypothetical protein [Niveibacterium umoris]MBB4011041.1 hypothetical protein [Niveibacterium umoris]